MFRGRELNAYFMEITKYADTLLIQTRQVPCYVMDTVQRNRFQKGRQTHSVMAAVAEQRCDSEKIIFYITQHLRKSFLFKQGKYGNDYRTQQATHGQVCLAKNYQLVTYRFTVRSGKLAQKRKKIISGCSGLVHEVAAVKECTAQAATRTGSVIRGTTTFQEYSTEVRGQHV